MNNRKTKTAFLTKSAMIAALYVLLTEISALLGISSGVIQFRLSEMFAVLPIFTPAAIPGVFIGCMISNIITGGVFWDVIFGSLASLLGAWGAWALRKKKRLPCSRSDDTCEHDHGSFRSSLCLRCGRKYPFLHAYGRSR